MAEQNPLLQAALDYCGRGWKVVPIHWPENGKCSCGKDDCQSPAKHPLTEHGLKDATTNKGLVAQWWKRWPKANVAIITGGESGLVVLDVDQKNGGMDSIKAMTRKLGNLPYTPTVSTGGGGEHYFMAHPGNGVRYRNKAALAGYQGIDVRGDGGYVVAHPSQHISGKKYVWKIHHIGTNLSKVPDWLAGLIRGDEKKTYQAPAGKDFWSNLWGGVGEGQRNESAAKLAGRLLGRGMQQEEALRILSLWNEHNTPPLTHNELAMVVWSIARSEDQKPGVVGMVSADQLLTMELERIPEIIGKGVLPEGGGLILTGESGVGKSLLSLEISIRLSKGMNLWELEVPEERRIMIIQKENTPQSVQWRLKKIRRGLGVSSIPNIVLVEREFKADMGQERDRRRIKDLIEKVRPKVVVLDPLISYHQANENDNVQMRRIMDSFTDISRETGIAWIIVHHEGKPGEKAKESRWRYRGASSIRDWADTMMGLTHKTNNEKKDMRLLNFDKIRHGPGRPSLLLERNEYFVHEVTEEDSTVPMSLVAELLQDMGGKCKGRSALVKAIVETTNCARKTAYRAIEYADGKVLDEMDNYLVLRARM